MLGSFPENRSHICEKGHFVYHVEHKARIGQHLGSRRSLLEVAGRQTPASTELHVEVTTFGAYLVQDYLFLIEFARAYAVGGPYQEVAATPAKIGFLVRALAECLQAAPAVFARQPE